MTAAEDAPQAQSAPVPGQTPGPQSRMGKKRGPYNTPKLATVAVTVRLEPETLKLLEDAVDEKAAAGIRLTKQEAVAQAIRWYWGKRRRR